MNIYFSGDIYYQCITHDTPLDKYSPINYKSYCILNTWENVVSSQTDTLAPLTITEKSNMQHVYECKFKVLYDHFTLK